MSSGLARASTLIAAGTLVSRITGLVRTIVLVTAIGAIGQASDAFGIANQLPSTVLALISTGLLTGVIVPRVVSVSAQEDGGRLFLPKLLTVWASILFVATALSMLTAPWMVWALAGNFTAEQSALATSFAYWCLPQIFFYGMFALIGETLNARRVFTPYAWAPVVNNLISIVGFGLFIVLYGVDRSSLDGWDAAQVALIGGTATLGIVTQTVLLMVSWRRSGIPLRLDFRWRGVGFDSMGKLASWTFSMVLVSVFASIIQQRTISAASGQDASIAVWSNAWLIYMVPYALIVLSIGTPYFTRISEHADAGRPREVLSDAGAAIRTLGLFIVIASAALMVAAAPASRIFTNHATDALAAAPVLIAFLVALTPMAVLFVIQRMFYAYGDTRTPFFFTLFQGSVIVGLTLAATGVPKEYLTATVAAVQTLAGILQLLLATWLLRRKLGPLGLRRSLIALLRFTAAAIPASAAGYGVYVLSGGATGWMLQDKLLGTAGAALIGIVCVVVYALILILTRVPEMKSAIALVRTRFGR